MSAAVLRFPPPRDEIATFEETAALAFDPVDIDLKALPTSETINNPHLVNVRLAGCALTRTKGELIDMAVSLGGLEPDGGDFAELVRGLQSSQQFFDNLRKLLSNAETRLMIAAHAANL